MKKLTAIFILTFFCCNLFAQNIPSYIPTNGLVGWWPFNGNANDESGNGNNGTVNGATLTTDRFGNVGSGYNFDNNQNISVADNYDLRLLGNQFTITLWYKFNNLNNPMQFFISKSHGGGTQPKWVINNLGNYWGNFHGYGGSALGMSTNNNPTDLFSSMNEDTLWHQLIVRRINSSLDIISDGTTLSTKSINEIPITTCSLILGGDEPSGGGHWLRGKLDDIAIYNRALTQEEFTSLYQGSSTNNSNNNGSVGINTTSPHPSAALDITDTQRGLLIPRMTASQRNNINNPAEGLMVFQTDDSTGFWYYSGQKWNTINSKGIKGDQGLQGLQGVKGDSGISIRSSRVNGDSLYINLNNGQTINAGNVRGLTGLQGLQGIQGPQGEQGIQGTQGIQGLKGDSGISVSNTNVQGDNLYITLSNGQTINAGNVRGLTGAQGPQGEQGLRGDSGISIINTKVTVNSLYITLSNGQTINAGSVRGLTGAQGPQGPQGTQGIQGPQGEQGIQGFLQNGSSPGNTPYWNGTSWVTSSSNIYNNGGNVGINTSSPNTSALLELQSTNRGFLPPRMTYAQRNVINNPTQGLIIYCTNCDTSGQAQIFNGSKWTNLVGGSANGPLPPNSTQFSIGDYYAGGIIFYVDSTDHHGLICTDYDVNSGVTGLGLNLSWGCQSILIYGTSDSVGTGGANTSIILNGCNERPIAASICDEFVSDGYIDWFLPSVKELKLMYTNLHLQGLGSFTTGTGVWYVSSSQFGMVSSHYRAVDFINGYEGYAPKDWKGRVRAVRSF